MEGEEQVSKEGVVVVTNNKVSEHLDTATEESLIFLTKAFRGAVRMDESENRVLLGAASATVGAWSRWQATQSAQRQTEVALANMAARDLGGKPTEYLPNVPARLSDGSRDED